jgi:hypothetical protein
MASSQTTVSWSLLTEEATRQEGSLQVLERTGQGIG